MDESEPKSEASMEVNELIAISNSIAGRNKTPKYFKKLQLLIYVKLITYLKSTKIKKK